jgi:hypothetical protein
MIGQHAKAVTNEVKAIPKETLAKKVLKTVSGLLVIGLAILFAKAFSAPWYVSVGTAMVGAHIISAELVGKSVKFMVGVLKDILAAVKGGKKEDEE